MTERPLTFALAGNANVGKSVIFNHLTGLHQHIGNWPGKTVEKAEGTLHFEGHTIDIIDLPGIYSLSTYSIEERVSREYIAVEAPNLVINVVDASVLERNLYFTLQVMELKTPVIIALNQIDIAQRNGIEIDIAKLATILSVPIIPTVAVKGLGVYELLAKSVEVATEDQPSRAFKIRYGKEIEARIGRIVESLMSHNLTYPARYTAIKLLEGDEEIIDEVKSVAPQTVRLATELAVEIEGIHGHSCATAITCERYEVAGRIAREVQRIVRPSRPPLRERLHTLTTHPITGYPIMLAAVLAMFFAVFTFGDITSGLLGDAFAGLRPLVEGIFGTGIVGKLLWEGVMEGVIAGVTVALPYIAPFYLILYVLEDSGYLSRIAFLMDSVMHKIGLHGKAFIPAMLGYGCSVPACLGCRIMETERERLLAGFVTTLVPCAARTVIILGLVGTFMGVHWALALYVFNLVAIFALGRLAFITLPGEPTALIMEMHDFRMPHVKTVVTQAWFRLEEFIKIAFPLIIAGSIVIQLLAITNLLEPIGTVFSPVTVAWLGLPAVTAVTLIFGILRKELTLVMLATLMGTTDFATVLTPVQMVVFTLVTMFYIPCIATIAALVREFGGRKAILITLFEITFALILGGVASRILSLIGLS